MQLSNSQDIVIASQGLARMRGAVIASAANIHLAAQRRMDLLRCARNDGKSRHSFTISRREAPESCMKFSPH
jgi:hypothetical protein